jgi:starch-binding outer membrane protein, SusD/RagB family
MRKIIYARLIFLFIITLMFSCTNKDKLLNLKPQGEFSEAVVWTDPALVEAFVNSMYRNNMGFPFGNHRLSDFSDESRTTWATVTQFNKSLMTPDGLLEWENGFGNGSTAWLRWNPLYANVRRENMFFSKINAVPATTNKEWIDRLKGEVYFNRAMSYHYLVALYGGVPIITKPFGLTDAFALTRNSYEDCINFIVGQLDSAALFLPDKQNNAKLAGRATKGAALALKARVLLYAASDLHNPQKNGLVSNGFSNPELLGYTGGDAAARWKAAKDAAKAVMDLNLYSLYKPEPGEKDSVAQHFVDYFLSYGTTEDILLQFFTPASGNDGAEYRPGVTSCPNGYDCWGNQTPLGELVDDYEMKDGSKFDWNNPVHKANPYANREARFYATILYEGTPYRKRPDSYQKIDPWNKIQVGRIYDPGGNLVLAGIDTRDGPVNVANGGYTGYYTHKFIDPTIDAAFVQQDIPFRHMRYAEVILNYAEACMELGETAQAHTYINLIRKRAGQPNLDETLTGDALRQAIRHERRIELVYENSRFWDIRRWLIGETVHHQTHAIDVRYITSEKNIGNYRRQDGSTWSSPVFAPVETAGDARVWHNKVYFFPIMRDEINKNNKLIQNPGY